MPSLISSILWVPQGVSARHPRTYDLADPGELERVERLGKIKLEDAQRDLEALEAQDADGMDVEVGKSDSGDEWEDEDDSSEGDEDDDDEQDEDPESKARKAKARILKSQQKQPDSSNSAIPVDEMAKYKLDDYDNEDERSAALGMFGNIKGLSFSAHKDGKDPYITLDTAAEEDANDERGALEVLPSDNLLVSGRSADDVNMLEVHLYEGPAAPESPDAVEEQADYEGNMYVHHDTLLPAMPLCLAWGDCRPSTSRQAMDSADGSSPQATGSFVAIGTLDSQIEIWDLDVVEGLFPEAILGDDAESSEAEAAKQEEEVAAQVAAMEVDSTKKSKKKKKKSAAPVAPQPVGILPYAHTDSVLSLAWNRTHRSLLASSSADGSIKLWDLSFPTCQRAIRSFDIFEPEAKILCIQWNWKEPTVLVAASTGGHVRIFDTRSPENHLSLRVPGKMQGRQGKETMQHPDVEVVQWDPLSESGSHLYIATSKGQVLYYDSRDLTKPIWTLDAHDGACSALDINTNVPGCFSTGGADKQTKIWNIDSSSKQIAITLALSKDFGVGRVFATAWNPDDPCVLACSGATAQINIFDAWTNAGFRKAFGDRVRQRAEQSENENWVRMFRKGGTRERASGTTRLEDEDAASDDD